MYHKRYYHIFTSELQSISKICPFLPKFQYFFDEFLPYFQISLCDALERGQPSHCQESLYSIHQLCISIAQNTIFIRLLDISQSQISLSSLDRITLNFEVTLLCRLFLIGKNYVFTRNCASFGYFFNLKYTSQISYFLTPIPVYQIYLMIAGLSKFCYNIFRFSIIGCGIWILILR